MRASGTRHTRATSSVLKSNGALWRHSYRFSVPSNSSSAAPALHSKTGLPPFIVGQFYRFPWQQLNTTGYGNFYCGEIVAVYQRKIQWKWFNTSKLASRAIITLSKQQPVRIPDRDRNIYSMILHYIATKSGIRYLQVSALPVCLTLLTY